MDRINNPYAPGAGLQPPTLTGRDQLLEDAAIDMQRALKRRPTQGMMLLGLRGVGKTVLLNRLHEKAMELGFQTVKIEAPESGRLAQLLLPGLRQIIYHLDLRQKAKRLVREAASVLRNFASAFELNFGGFEFGISPSPGRADTGNLEQDLPMLLVAVVQAAKESDTAIAFFLDEVQYLSRDELAAIVVSCHEIAQQGLPFYFVGAGLPQIARLAGNAKSYAERLFTYPEIGPLPAGAAKNALIQPAAVEGVAFTKGAVEEIISQTKCYPYFLQEWGSQVWNAAPETPITLDDVVNTTPGVIEHLDANFFRVRFDRLTPLEQKYLRAMAELGSGPYKTGDIAAALGVEASSVAVVRQNLIDKGMVWSQRHGETAFTVPMFDQFMLRQMPELIPHVPNRRRCKPES